MILSRVALLLTLVASIHGLTLPKDGDDLAILTGDRREHRRNHPAEAPPPTTTTTPKPYADCTFSSALFIACIFYDNHSSVQLNQNRFSGDVQAYVQLGIVCALAHWLLGAVYGQFNIQNISEYFKEILAISTAAAQTKRTLTAHFLLRPLTFTQVR